MNSTIQVVAPTAPNGNNDGLCSLSEAIVAANNDTMVDGCAAGAGADTIVIPAGTYTLTQVDNMTAVGPTGLPIISTDITLQGAGSATTIIERSTAMGTPDFRILLHLGSTLTVTGVTLRNGRETVVGGGAIWSISGTSLTVANSVFSDNEAGNADGGAIAGDFFGAVAMDITDSTFTGNSALSGGAVAGAASGTVVCTRCLFVGNSALNGGGGALFSRNAVTIQDSLFSGNTATGSAGAVLLSDVMGGAPSLIVSGSTFEGNSADTVGAIAASRVLSGSLVNSTISGNMTTGDDAGIRIFDNSGPVTLNNLTITGNSAGGATGGLGISTPSAAVTLANSIVAANTAVTQSPDCLIDDAGMQFSSQGFNLIGNGDGCNFPAAGSDQVGTGGAPIDPLLGALANNGGPTAGAVATAIPTHFPQPGSPALDAGNNVDAIGGAFPACRADDQIDVARPLGPRCDIGAIESSADADLAITKADSPDPVNRGDDLTYTFTVTNNGPGGAGDIQVVDNLPPGLTFVSATPSQGTCMEAALTVTCDPGILANGDSATIDIVATTTAAGMLSNTATVTTSSNDTDLSNNSDTETTVVDPVTDVSITKTDDADPVDVGDDITYTVTVTNNGPDNATGVSVMDTLPGNVTFNTATPSQGMCAEVGGLVTCNLGAIANGNSATVLIVVTTMANGILTNTVTVSADGVDTNPGNNQASQTTSVGQMADLILSKADTPDPIGVTINLNYTLVVANAGPEQATGVMLTDTLPAGTTFGSVTTSQGTCAHSMGVVTCDLGTINTQSTATVTIVAAAPDTAGPITNTASVTLNEPDPNPANNSASATTDVVDFEVSVMPASVTVMRGNTAIYTVTVTPLGGRFDFSVTLDCEMEPTATTCIFSPPSVVPGGGPFNATLNLTTTAPSTAALPSSTSPLYAVWLLAPLGLLALRTGRRRRALAVLALVFVLVALQAGCGGSDDAPSGTPAVTPIGTHTFTVRGIAGTLQRSTTVMVVVQ